MKFSEQWLREWVNPDISSHELSEQLSMAGLEVDAVEPVADEFHTVVVGEVIECGPHPDADKLQITKVDVGDGEPVDIVCGASNCRLGIKVAVAKVGAVLPGDFKIKKAKLRGQPSNGMLCSFKELGLIDEHDGIIELPADAPVGEDYRKYLQLDDNSIDIDLTPNRGDCLSIRGIAREVGVLNRLDVKVPESNKVAAGIEDTLSISLSAAEQCPRYLGRVIKGVDLTRPTPVWMTEKLRRSGIRSIDPVVDVTNYVLLELGHPMHAFDLDSLEGNIDVRLAKRKEQLTLLDEQLVELDEDTLVISDEKKALAMAGVYGGKNSGVTESSKNIFLESAFFAPDAILGKARRYGLHTDASHRYERGVDPQLQHTAMERATELLLAICGGKAGPVTEAVAEAFLPKRDGITLRASRLAKVLGVSIANDNVTEILERLGFDVSFDGEQWQVGIPSYRFDLSIEEDLIEEVARVYGYNSIQAAPPAAQLRMTERKESQLSTHQLVDAMVSRGYQEAITYSFVDPKHQALMFDETAALTLPHPISVDMSSMRVSLWPGLVGAVAHNQKRQQSVLAFVETGLRFIPDESAENGVRQEAVISGIRSGKAHSEHWSEGDRGVDFYDVKGDVEALLAQTGNIAAFRFVASQNPALHPGQSAAIYCGSEKVGDIGALHPKFDKALGLNQRTFVFELSLSAVTQRPLPLAKPVSRYPSIRRDLALVVDKHVAAGELIAAMENVGVKQLVDLNLFDVYVGEGVPEGKQSLALSVTLQDSDKTLEEADVTELMTKFIETLKSEFNATLRD
ncbi:phenylalanine--tRNA ligase subunit beta [Idiomarina ramblicola]|uniref:Phenylalanine--tRNA ligase beta subunit n=1 Tax=Idiomarina ramblicola TaxID=263724 RepID=A0A432Z5C5_9GAMM|nr:phenylalanine--tRNA ligase subunit beta [Idiomarina ramblicola]RUO73091.1 phenylalanine--tRNA ligase subunit beta [Idiomarina ramblicola]